ncbi:hypothetical protein MPSI1_002498 [Malassezia psittaci]|uniref:Uncharacterized protein n=1 Tax=Malassezia psittaci TaxID=1821823 RepID=A0AAF0F6X5_9BASI|nr:hypothetical protein MPSI1_002498 [Malassezia psittaci]
MSQAWFGTKPDFPSLSTNQSLLQWSELIFQFTLAILVHGSRVCAVFAIFPVALFVVMELSGYIVLLSTGIRHKDNLLESAVEKSETKQSQQAAHIDDKASSLSTSIKPSSNITTTEPLRERLNTQVAEPATN